jgi:hypothetical protein
VAVVAFANLELDAKSRLAPLKSREKYFLLLRLLALQCHLQAFYIQRYISLYV